MDLAKTLIRSVVRAFYETRHVLVIDALMIHSALPNEDLALLLGMQQKDLRKLCGKLREDRLLAVHSRQETREGQQRPINKDYYYIDFHATIDAIKYRIFKLTQKVKDLYKPSEEKKDYHCPRCKAQWTQLEVLDKVGPMGFLCHRCNGLLERDERSAGDSTGHEKQSKLMSQLESLLKLLQQIDSEDIPSNNFEIAFAVMVPVKRNEDINPTRLTAPLDAGKAPPAAVKGIKQNDIQPLEISVTTSSERTAAEQAAEAKRKAEIAAQNVLPVWHTASTVTGERTDLSNKDRAALFNSVSASSDSLKPEVEDKEAVVNVDDELTAYYAQMEKEKEREAQQNREADEEDEDDDDEDDDEFEDVGLGATAGTPSSSISASANFNATKTVFTNGKVKQEPAESESGSSAPVTGNSTPARSQLLVVEEDEDAGPETKRIKVEAAVVNGVGVGGKGGEDSDEDEEMEFEDAL